MSDPKASAASEPSVPLISIAMKALGMLGILTLLTGVLYPLLITGIAKVAFEKEANGSLVVRNGRVIGSRFVGQSFEDPKYFWGRLSATAPTAYNGGASAASNVGPTNEALTKSAKARVDALRAADPEASGPIPVDLVTASASGLDPHISPAAALWQAPRVARARRLDEAVVRALIATNTEERSLGVLGEPRVNVLLLNLALDDASARTKE